MTTIKEWLDVASEQLNKVGIVSSKLDSEIILSNVIKKPRTFIHANGETILTPSSKETADNYLELRLQRIPIAYIIGMKEFYGRVFNVSSNTLIPRPESESMIELLSSLVKTSEEQSLIDVGTGTGCIGITAKLENPYLDVTILDIDDSALEIARNNAERLSAKVTTIVSDLLTNCTVSYDFILANLPYVDRSWDRSIETNYEPEHALFADDFGKALINKLIIQSPNYLNANGYLIIEADPRQHKDLITTAASLSFKLIHKEGYVLGFSYPNRL